MESEYVTYPMVYVIRSKNIWSSYTYTTYDKALKKLKEFENLSPNDGSVGEIVIEYHKNGKLIKGFNEDTQRVER